MREIKFRAWDGEKMIKNFSISAYGDIGWINPPKSNYPIMQFTGLHDKNGKEIYEGDVCKGYNSYDYEYGLAICEFETCDMTHISFFHFKHIGDDSGKKWGFKLIEIIGNIHENPELLK